MKSFYLIIDSLLLNVTDHSDVTLYLEEKMPFYLTRVCIKSIILFGTKEGICYIHCDILNKDDNMLNGERSDVLAIVSIITSIKSCKPVSLQISLRLE